MTKPPSRTAWFNRDLDKPRRPYDSGGEVRVVTEGAANLTSSLIEGTGNRHLPVLDIDFPARLVPSSSKGHFHLYLDGMKPLPWWRYRLLLRVLAWAGVIEPGYYTASVARRMTLVRLPGVKKKVKG